MFSPTLYSWNKNWYSSNYHNIIYINLVYIKYKLYQNDYQILYLYINNNIE